MSFDAGSIVAEIVLNTPGFDAGVKRAIEGTKAIEQNVAGLSSPLAKAENAIAQTGGKAGDSYAKGFIKSLKSQMGEESAFGGAMAMLRGGGAMVGVAVVAQQLQGMAAAMEKFAIAAATGESDTGELVANMLRSIPVAGQLGDAFARFYELASGTTAAVARLKLETERTERLTAAMAAHLAVVKASTRDADQFIQDIGRQIARLGLSGTGLKLFDIDTAALERIKAILDQAEKLKAGDEIKKIEETVAKAREAVAKAGASRVGVVGWETINPAGGGGPRQVPIFGSVKTREQEQLELAEKQLNDAKAAIDAGAARKTVESEKLRWAQKIEAAREGAAAWLSQNLGAANEAINQSMKAAEAESKQQEAARRVAEALDSIRVAASQSSMSEGERKLDDLRRMGADDSQLGEARKLLDQIEKSQAKNEMQRAAEQWARTLQTPQEKWESTITELNKLLLGGAISEDLFSRGLASADEELKRATAKGERGSGGLASLIQGGTAEAAKYQAELALMVRGGDQQIQKEQLDVSKQMLAELKRKPEGDDSPVVDLGGLA
jgi:predicted hydrocarbon binding protein